MTDTVAGEWELWRQDDNGNRFRIARFTTREAAEAEQRRFEALGHKQTYWVHPVAGEEGKWRPARGGPATDSVA